MFKRKNRNLLQENITINGKRISFYGRTKAELTKKIAEYKEDETMGLLRKMFVADNNYFIACPKCENLLRSHYGKEIC